MAARAALPSVALGLGCRTDRLHAQALGPLFSIDTRNGDILWELWIEGFEKAVELRPEANAGHRLADVLGLHEKVARNDPCPCGSGKKYKKCCGLN
jgi:hypothetical protein